MYFSSIQFMKLKNALFTFLFININLWFNFFPRTQFSNNTDVAIPSEECTLLIAKDVELYVAQFGGLSGVFRQPATV